MKRRMILALMVTAVAVATSAFSVLDRRPPHTYKSVNLYPKEFKPGDAATLVFIVERIKDCPGTVFRSITFSDGEVYNYDALVAAVGDRVQNDPYSNYRGGVREGKIVREFIMPRDSPGRKVPRGPAQYNARIDYYCNLFQQALRWPIQVKAPSIDFAIIDGEGEEKKQ